MRPPVVLLRRPEFAARLRVSLATVKRWGAAGLLDERRPGPRLVLVTESSVNALIAKRASGNRDGLGVKVTPGNAAIQGGAASGGRLVVPPASPAPGRRTTSPPTRRDTA